MSLTIPHKMITAVVAGLVLAGCSSFSTAPYQVVTTPDNPEPGMQGETMEGEAGVILPVPYSEGVNVVGHSPVDNRVGNLAMTWSDDCAYVASGFTFTAAGQLQKTPVNDTAGVAVIDVSNPLEPQVVRYLQDKGAMYATETLHALNLPGRAVLATSSYGGVPGINGPKEGWLSLYDVSDCANPILKAELKWPEPVHTLTLSPDARYVYGTVLNPFTGEGGIQVMDIGDTSAPRFVGKFEATRADGSSFQFGPHELIFNADGTRIYAGVTTSQGANTEHEFKNTTPGVPSPAAVGRDAGGIFIFDNSDFVEGKTDPKLRLISSAAHAGWHSPTRATINGVPYIINAGELGACPGAWPRLTDISDENNPKVVADFQLEMNIEENCPPLTPMERMSGGLVSRPGFAASHFQDVDNSDDTRLGLFPFSYAGLRIFDIREPLKASEVAYFKPGDPCMSHVNYDDETGHIWFACNTSGFWVIAVKPELHRSLGL